MILREAGECAGLPVPAPLPDGESLSRPRISEAVKECLDAAVSDSPSGVAGVREFLLALCRSSRIEDDLIDQLFNSAERRLARLLLLLANFGEDGGAQPIAINLSQETLAEMIGTTRSRVSFFMNKFRKLGFIEYNGSLKIHNSLLSVVLHD